MDKSNFQKNIEIISPNDHYKRNQFESTGFRWADEENLVAISNGNGEITLKSDEILMVARELLNNYDVLKKWYEVIEETVEEISNRYEMLPESIKRCGFSVCSDGLDSLLESITNADDFRELIGMGPGSGGQSTSEMIEEEIIKRLTEKSIDVIETRGGHSPNRYNYESVELFLSYTWLNPKNPIHHGGPGSTEPGLETKIMELVEKIENDKNLKSPQAYLNIINFSTKLLRKLDATKTIWSINPYNSNYEAILNWFAMMDILASDEFTCRFIEYELIREIKDSRRPYKLGYAYNYEQHGWSMDFMMEEGLSKLIYIFTKAMYTYASTFAGGIDLNLTNSSRLEDISGDLFSYYCF